MALLPALFLTWSLFLTVLRHIVTWFINLCAMKCLCNYLRASTTVSKRPPAPPCRHVHTLALIFSTDSHVTHRCWGSAALFSWRKWFRRWRPCRRSSSSFHRRRISLGRPWRRSWQGSERERDERFAPRDVRLSSADRGARSTSRRTFTRPSRGTLPPSPCSGATGFYSGIDHCIPLLPVSTSPVKILKPKLSLL